MNLEQLWSMHQFLGIFFSFQEVIAHTVFLFFFLAIHKVSITKVVKQKVLLWFRAWVTWHPPVHHPKNPVLGFRGWDEILPQGSVSLVSSFFFPGPFFFSYFFFCPRSRFFPGTFFSLAFFWSRHPWTQIFFLETPTYSSNLPTPLPPSNPSTSPYLPHHPFALPFIARSSKP